MRAEQDGRWPGSRGDLPRAAFLFAASCLAWMLHRAAADHRLDNDNTSVDNACRHAVACCLFVNVPRGHP